MDERVAVPVVQGGRPQPFLGQPAMFDMDGNAVSGIEAELIARTAAFKRQRDAEIAMIRAQEAQKAALREALMSPQAQAMVNAQYGAG